MLTVYSSAIGPGLVRPQELVLLAWVSVAAASVGGNAAGGDVNHTICVTWSAEKKNDTR